MNSDTKSLVSVIIPTRNRRSLLLECLESIFKQTYCNIEIIVVDDASSDDTKQMIDSLQREVRRGIRYIRLNSSVGPGLAREQGRCIANGVYVCYQDSDDIWDPQKIELQVRCLEENPGAGMCYCASRIFERTPIRGDEPLRKNSDQEYSEFLPLLLKSRARPWGTGACMWTKDAVDVIGPWLGVSTWEDFEYECRAGCNNIRIVHLPDVLCFYRNSCEYEQLRRVSKDEIVRQRTVAVIEIGKNLKKHNKLVDTQIRSAYSWLVFDQLISLILTKQLDFGKRFIESVKQLQVSSLQFNALLGSTLAVTSLGVHGRVIWLIGRLISRIASYPVYRNSLLDYIAKRESSPFKIRH